MTPKPGELAQGPTQRLMITCALDFPPTPTRGTPEDPKVRFVVLVNGRIAYEGSATTEEMRLPTTLEGVIEHQGLSDLTVPAYLLEELVDALGARDPDEPIWFRLDAPHGPLPAAPWEYLLQARLGAPLLRLADATVPVTTNRKTLDVAVCAPRSSVRDRYLLRPQLERVVERVRSALPGATRVHVFTDAKVMQRLLARIGDDVIVHQTPKQLDRPALERDAAGPAAAQDLTRDPIENEWLRWMADALGDTSVDAVHFICPGHLSATRGALRLGRDLGEDETSWPLVNAFELNAFLARVGAYAVTFTVPTKRAWPSGIRMLAHDVVAELVGTVIVDAPYHAGDSDQLDLAYGLLRGGGTPRVPRSRGLAIYAHPLLIAGSAPSAGMKLLGIELQEEALSLVRELTLGGTDAAETLTSAADPPRQLVANQRAFEQVASDLLTSQTETPTVEGLEEGITEALAFLRDLAAEDAEQETEEKA